MKRRDRPSFRIRNVGIQNAEFVLLANPLSSDMDVLRPSLLPGLIHSLQHNLSRKNYDVALFEIGRVFHANESENRMRNVGWPLR